MARKMRLISLSFFIPIALFFSSPLQAAPISALEEAERLFNFYSEQIAKRPPPSPLPQITSCLETASVWFSIDCSRTAPAESGSVLEAIGNAALWGALKEIGFEGVYLDHLRAPDGLGINPAWGNGWSMIEQNARTCQLSLIGEGVPAALDFGPDFDLALRNVAPYTSLFHLVEIPEPDWSLLPDPYPGESIVNVPWLELQALYKKGYVPEDFDPYVKKSAWNATPKIACIDGKWRRWIYLQSSATAPMLAWLTPTFAASRLGAGALLYSLFELGQKTLFLDGSLPLFAKETLALWTRKMGGFSVEKTTKGWQAYKTLACDALLDTTTPAALLHALIAEDAEALRLIYRLFLHEEISLQRLVHRLQPFDVFSCDWSQWLSGPKRKIFYWQEQVTSDILIQKLLREDLYRLGDPTGKEVPASTWTGYCKLGLNTDDEKQIQKGHLLLAFFYAMQPGIFSLSADDLLGTLPETQAPLNLFGPTPGTAYPSLAIQLRSQNSFASQLRKLLDVRKNGRVAQGSAIAVPAVQNKGAFLLLQTVNGSFMLTAVNFSRTPITEKIDFHDLRYTRAVELQSGKTEEKEFPSSSFSFTLPPLSGKVFLFQKKGT